ncbi:MAG TPA: aldo/keto reductase [Gammaproteobacteria bacterium]|nr:aldo/keto reductase [Gammaproteobacteria bacterium]
MKRLLGNAGPAVGPIGLGGMPLSIQNRPDERAALAVIEAFVAAGGDHIDTAISYCLDEHDFGHNERLIAKALRKLGRTDVVVATKGGLTRPDGRWEVDCSPQWLRHCCEQSARTLGAPIPLYYLHTVDPAVPLAESIGELVRLRDEGKIAAIGLSNVNARHLDEALRLTPIAAVQNRCNVLDTRDFDLGLVERCRALGVAYVPYSPVGGHSGHRRLDQYPTLARVAEKHGTTPYVIALAWLLAQGPHIVPIPGATKISSIESSLGVPRVQLDVEDLAALGALGSRGRTTRV